MPEYVPDEEDIKYEAFLKEIRQVINKHSRENRSNTPDFMLAEFMTGCLNVYENTIRARETWFNIKKTI